MMELEQLRQLVAFAEYGTLSKAAEELTERVQLAHKSRQRVFLGSCAPVPIQDLKPLFRELYHDVMVCAELNDSDEALLDGLRQGRYHIVITHQAPPQDTELFSFAYREEHLSLLVPIDHPLAQLPVIHADDLAHQNLLLYSEIGFWTQICWKKPPDAHFLFMNEWDAFGELVGLRAFPSFVTDAFDPERPMENKVVIPIKDEDFQTAYYFLYLEKDREKYQKIIERLQEKRFRTEPL